MVTTISREQRLKLQKLIFSDDFQKVLLGLAMFTPRNEKELYHVLNIQGPIKELQDIHKELHPRDLGWPYICHKNYIKLWALGKLVEYQVPWTMSLSMAPLKYNNLYRIPHSFVQLTSLSSVDASSNKLTSLPKDIGNLSNLKQLYLGRNKLTRLPASIGDLVNLRQLILSDNDLTQLPKSIYNLTNLTSIYLANNRLSFFQKRTLKKHFGKKIDLQMNRQPKRIAAS